MGKKTSLNNLSCILFLLCSAATLLVVNTAFAHSSKSAAKLHVEDDYTMADEARRRNEPRFIATTTQVQAIGSPSAVGQWGPIVTWPFAFASAASLPDGRIIAWGANNLRSFNGGNFTYASVWNPANGQFLSRNHNDHPMFCGIPNMLEDGRVFVNGGDANTNKTSIFDYRTNQWVRSNNMSTGRWYPGSLALPSGQIFTMLGRPGGPYPEVWTEGSGWSLRTGANLNNGILNFSGYQSTWLPYVHLMPNGNIFHSGPTTQMNVINPGGNGSISSAGLTNNWYPKYGAAIMYDEGKILVAGGAANSSSNAPGTNQAMILDVSGPTPTKTNIASMAYARKFSNGVMLPNGEVLIIGGNTSGREFSDQGSILAAEIWNPVTRTWREVANMSVPRNYHSVALLMTDGRVWSGGGGLCNCSADHPDHQIYSPPYLFNSNGTLATRPVISSAPDVVANGQTINVQASSGIQQFSLIKMSGTTHHLNSDLRYLNVSFSGSGGQYQLQLHSNNNVLTPGYWMLFAINGQGVPSVAKVLQLSSTAPPPPGEGSGQILREWWTGITGNAVSNLTGSPNYPDNATGSSLLDLFETPSNFADNYGTRVRGFLHPPITGQYRFWIASDDQGELLLSSNSNPANAVQIANVPVWASPRQWDKYSQQQSTLITLQAGQTYYIEALQKEGGGLDNLAVAWQIPGSARAVIEGEYLSPYELNQAPSVTSPGNQSDIEGASVSLAISASDPDGDTLSYSASSLPSGLAINSNTGVISGTISGGSSGNYNSSVTVNDGNGGTDSVNFNWTVQAVPGLILNPISSIPQQQNTSVNYTASFSGGLNPRFKWLFGDGTPETSLSTSPSISHTYTQPGRYLVTLTAIDDAGQQETEQFFQLVYRPLTAQSPSVSMSIIYEQRGGSDFIWNVNPDNDTVSVSNAVTLQKIAEIAVGSGPRALALAPDGRIWVTNKHDATISIINTGSLSVVQTVNLPESSQPYGIVFAPNGSSAFVSLEATGTLLKLNPSNGAQTGSANVGENPRHLSVLANSSRVYVSRFISPPAIGEDTASPQLSSATGEIVVVNSSSMGIVQTITLQHSNRPDTEGNGRGMPNYLGPAIISPDGGAAWVPSKQDNIARGTLRDGLNLDHDHTVRSITSFITLSTNQEQFVNRIDHDNGGIASSGQFDPYGAFLFVALEGSREVAVIDAYARNELFRIDVGHAPQGVAVSPDGLTLYVHNFMDRSVSVYDLDPLVNNGQNNVSQLAVIDVVASEQLSAQVLRGKQLFYDAKDTRLALDAYISCASCHNDGGQDGRVWDFTGFGEGLRNTINLAGHGGLEHGLLHWTGNFDEMQDFENQIRQLAGGTGLMSNADFNATSDPLGASKTGRSADLDALAAYVESLTTFADSPFRVNGALTANGVAGKTVFENANCVQCHSGEGFTDSSQGLLHDIGTLKASSGNRLGAVLPGIDTPTLRGVWATAPYLHDGSAATLTAAIAAHSDTILTSNERTQLASYLQQIDGREPGPTVVIGQPSEILTPVPGTTLSGATVTFEWQDVGATQHWLEVGASQGSAEYGGGDQGTSTSATLSGLPTDGSTVHVRLWTIFGFNWLSNDYQYTSGSGGGGGGGNGNSQIISPQPNSTLSGSSVTFQWSDEGADQYWLEVGSSSGGAEYFGGDQGTSTSATVSGLPTDGSTVYVRLWTIRGFSWQANQFQFTASSGGGGGGGGSGNSEIISPVPNTTLPGSTVTFQWSDVGADQYWLEVGLSQGSGEFGGGDQGTSTSATISGLPTDGSTVHVRLWTISGFSWVFEDFQFTSGP